MASFICRARWLGVLLAFLGTGGANRADDSVLWVSGDNLIRQLDAPLSVSWDNAPLARALESLSRSQHIAIVRDRRIDPGQPLTLAIDNEPLSKALDKIARHVKAGYCQFGPVAYLGPPETARRLRTLAALRLEDARKLPSITSRKFLSMRSSHWAQLSRPRDLANLLALEAGAKLAGAEQIPHDLWPETELPPLSVVDRLTLLAAQFEMTFRFDAAGKSVELIKLPDEVILSRTYLAGRDVQNMARRWAHELPEAKIAASGTKIRVDARLEDHEQIEAALHGKPVRRTTVTAGQETYQLSVESAALDKVVGQLGKQLNLDFQWDAAAIDAAGIAVDQLVSVKVSGASLDELLAAVSAGTGLSFHRTGRTVVIKPK
jgi:hypothetical protein